MSRSATVVIGTPSAATEAPAASQLPAAELPPDEALRGWEAGFFAPGAPPEIVDRTMAIVSQFHPAAFAALARSFAATDLRAVLPTIEVPTMVLCGDVDVRSPLDVGRAIHAAIPDAELVVLHGVGHISNLEAPGRFNREVRRFLATVD